jgi:hypothetical protein
MQNTLECSLFSHSSRKRRWRKWIERAEDGGWTKIDTLQQSEVSNGTLLFVREIRET